MLISVYQNIEADSSQEKSGDNLRYMRDDVVSITYLLFGENV